MKRYRWTRLPSWEKSSKNKNEEISTSRRTQGQKTHLPKYSRRRQWGHLINHPKNCQRRNEIECRQHALPRHTQIRKIRQRQARQDKMRGQRGTLPVYALGYVNSTEVIYRLAIKRKGVFRDINIKAYLDLMWLVNKWRWASGKVLSMKATTKKKADGKSLASTLNSFFRYKRLAGRRIRFSLRYCVGNGQQFRWYFFAQC